MQTETLALPTLKIDNENNKLACDVFTVIHFAPPVQDNQLVHGHMLGKRYLVNNEFEVELLHYEMMPLIHLESVHTLACSGLLVLDWQVKFITRFPKTDHLTKMAIYCYSKVVG